MSERCIYCDPDFPTNMDDDVGDREIGSGSVDAGDFGYLTMSLYATDKGIQACLFNETFDLIKEVAAKVRYCPMCGRKLKAEDKS